MKIVFSALAVEGLDGLSNYISNDLNNPIAAHNIVGKILHLAYKLSDFPELGVNLKTIDLKLAGYRYLIVDNYLIIYKLVAHEVHVLRILYARSDYVKLLQS